MRILYVLFPALLLTACQKQDVRLKVLIGETAIVAPDAQPIHDAIIVIAGQKVRSVGMRKDIPVPQNSDRTDLTGEWVVPTGGGRIAVGEAANLTILKHMPNGVAPANPADIGATIKDGEWVVPNTRQ
jgi:imidazolonepropionase-like amidohydrolase